MSITVLIYIFILKRKVILIHGSKDGYHFDYVCATKKLPYLVGAGLYMFDCKEK